VNERNSSKLSKGFIETEALHMSKGMGNNRIVRQPNLGTDLNIDGIKKSASVYDLGESMMASRQ
jgi:hypothetical protein